MIKDITNNNFSQIRKVLIYVLVLNWAVAFIKIFYGWAIKSASMGADGFHSLSDGASNIIGLIGIWVASRPVDKGHPYGHKKYETFFAVAISLFLFLFAFQIIENAWERLHRLVAPTVTVLSFVVMIITTIINLLVMHYEKSRGNQLKSDFLVADSLHTQSDIYVSLSVIVALISVKIGFPLVDVIAAFIIGILIAYAAYDILKNSSQVLCDTAVISPSDLKKMVMEIEGVKTCHRIRTRGRQDDIHVDLHVLVDAQMSADKTHDLSHKIEEVIKKKVCGVSDVIIHIEPATEKERRRI